MKHRIGLTWEIEEGVEVELDVTADYSSSAGNRRGHPDTWTPPYAELEICAIKNMKGCELPAAVTENLRDCLHFAIAVTRAILDG